jgi:formate-dependent nitrite reductase membrane component NrfD
VVSAATGLVLSTYTGALLGVTAIPVWARNVRVLPFQFGASGLGTAAAVLELRHDRPALRRIGAGAAVAETAVAAALECRSGHAFEPLHRGRSGMLARIGGLLAGPVPLVLRLIGRRSRALRVAAAVSALAGSALLRQAWMAAGKASAEDPREPLQLPDPPPSE